MKQLRVKGQALALVLIVVVVAVIIAFAISNRVLQDIKQQGAERSSTRVETIAESAIDDLTLKLQSGEIKSSTGPPIEYNISNQGSNSLGLCDPTSTQLEKQCDPKSVATITYYPYVLQLKYFDAENLEIFMAEPATNVSPSASNDSGIIIQLYTANNNSYDLASSKILIKGFSRNNGELKSVSECVFSLSTRKCLPDVLSIDVIACPTLSVTNLSGSTVQITPPSSDTNICFHVFVAPASMPAYAIALYRIRPLLTKSGTEIPFIDMTVSSNNAGNSYKLPVDHMAMITAGVYSGTQANTQQVFQQKTRLVLLHKSVPEIADYVIYNGSNEPITK